MRRIALRAPIAALFLVTACSRVPAGVSPTATPFQRVDLPPAWTPTPGSAATPTASAFGGPPPTGTLTTAAPFTRALQRTDLPGGFTPEALATYRLSPAALGGGSLSPLAFSAFSQNGGDTLIFSATFDLTDPTVQTAFGGFIQSPDKLLTGLTLAMGSLQGTASNVAASRQIGERSSAARASGQINGVRHDLQLVAFTAGKIGAYVLVVVRQGKNPGVDPQTAAESLLRAQTPTPTPEPPTPTAGG